MGLACLTPPHKAAGVVDGVGLAHRTASLMPNLSFFLIGRCLPRSVDCTTSHTRYNILRLDVCMSGSVLPMGLAEIHNSLFEQLVAVAGAPSARHLLVWLAQQPVQLLLV
ncbi:hypothetical protein J1N35_044115 [Gossypium stocksii]|uniref:Uncharacterized protein n=1 Tax=Gossypium stocksii TaxID=47602 RepID=A0A9D3ZFP2_9ROSI|nr:hypothetical protein J1N35_044115 [Gossypium stocksii]